MKVRQSASLVAGVCTLCVAASTSVAPVHAAVTATPEAKSPVVRSVELTAASDVLVAGVNVASLPLQNFITVLNALAGAAGGGNGTGGGGATSLQALPNLLYSQLVAGTLTSASATAAINAALATEQTALTNLSETPGKIIATDLAAINTLLAELGFGSLGVAAAATPFKAAAVTSDVTTADSDPTLVNIVNAASLPLQNFITVLNALAGAAGGGNGTGGGGATSLQALPNVLYSQLVAGTLTSASATAAINAALATEQTALTNLAATPGNIIAHDIEVLSALFGGSTASLLTANTNSIEPELKSAAVTQADGGTTVVDVINVASLPLQNGITALNALAGAAGGGNGVGGGGATSFQALPNLLYGQLVAGTLTEASASTAINAALTTEQTALTNLAATPGKIIATDIAAIQKLSGDFGGSALSVNKLQTNTLALKNTDVTPSSNEVVAHKVADQKDAKDATAGSTAPGRHAAKPNDNSPVSNAIKAIKEASKGSYVGKHRADSVGAKASTDNGENGKNGS